MHDEDKWHTDIEKSLIKSITADIDRDYRKQFFGEFSNMDNYGTSAISEEKQKIQRLEKELNEARHKLHDAQNEIMAVRLDQTSEKLLREQHPGLKELWVQYQAMLDLVKDY